MSVVTVSHVEKFYGNQGNITQALNDISFAVEKQEFTAVMGASGSGKTTLLNVISTIDAVSAGNIEINGNSICELRENELAEFRKKELGFIFQDFNLLILADEPTGALDSHSSYLLMEQFQRMNTELQATILMVTHDAFSASYAKRVLFLKDGTIFNEIYRGSLTRKAFFQKILDVMQLLGGDVHAVR